jgi:Zn-dependent protease with chaperone function
VFSASELVHPFDESARRELESLAGFETTVRAYGRVARRGKAGPRRLGPGHRPEVYRLLPPICAAFGLPEPGLYLGEGDVGACPAGRRRAAIILSGDLPDRLAPDEIAAVIAHECGHILLGHVRYRWLARFLEAPFAGGPAGSGPVPAPVRSALIGWSHKSELSADRAAAAYLGNADAITRVMFRLAGQSTDAMLAVRVREIQAWTATAGFARLTSSTMDGTALPVPRCPSRADR